MHWLLKLIPGVIALGEAIARSREERARLKRDVLAAKRAAAQHCKGKEPRK